MATPFELRFNVWREANNRLTEEYFAEVKSWNIRKEGKYPIFPTQKEVEEEAKKIYEFVKKQD